jgi:hypothetical protein
VFEKNKKNEKTIITTTNCITLLWQEEEDREDKYEDEGDIAWQRQNHLQLEL